LETTLVVAIGDIHGRFHRVQDWLAELERSLGRPLDLIVAVGDVEAFQQADDHRRKATKRTMPAEFADVVAGARPMQRRLWFVAGNNEDFEALEAMPEGGELAPNVTYLGRVGTRELHGLKLAYLSGIYAPRHYDTPRAPITSRETAKQAGYFRKPEVESLYPSKDIDLMLVHEWPRGLFARNAQGRVDRPWMGNPVTRTLAEKVKPQWLLCGHSHQPHAATLVSEGVATKVACLDQSAKPDGALFWIEYQGHKAVRAGWGTSGQPAWSEGQGWSSADAPKVAAEPSPKAR
jgi:predicted phosphodiesterase